MKTYLKGLCAAMLCVGLTAADAQPGRPGGGMGGPPIAQITAAMAQLFGDNQTFSASLENQIKTARGEAMTVPGKISFDSGKVRFEMNMGDMKGGGMPPEMTTQMKSMGMDSMIIISQPAQSASYMVYPNLKAYTSMPAGSAGEAKEADFKIETTELGRETVGGHPCIKNKAVVTDDKGKKHESTIWNATDLKDFPVKIETMEDGTAITMLFKNVKLTKPEASQFELPAGYKKYNNMMELVMERMRESGGMGMPPGQ